MSPTARFLLRLPRHRPDWLSCSPRLTGSLLCSAHGVIRTMRRAPCPKAAFARPRGGQLTALLGGSASMLGTVAVLLACLMYPTPLASCYATRCLPTLAWLTVHGDNEDCCEIPSTGVVWNADNLQFHRKSFGRLRIKQSALSIPIPMPAYLWGRPVVRLYGLLVDTQCSPPVSENERLMPFTFDSAPLHSSLTVAVASHTRHRLLFRSPALACIRRRTLVAASRIIISSPTHIDPESLTIAYCLTSSPHCPRTSITPYPPSVHHIAIFFASASIYPFWCLVHLPTLRIVR